MSKKLSIGTIKKELMDAMVNNVNIIDSFGKHEDVKTTSDYINRNIFSHLNIDELSASEASYINFDVYYERRRYEITIIVRAYKLLKDNREDVICDAITDIVNELYPYHTYFTNMSIRNNKNYIERQIRFFVSQDDADKYAKSLKEEEEDPVETMGEWVNRVDDCIEKFEKFCNSQNSITVNCDGAITISGDNIKFLSPDK